MVTVGFRAAKDGFSWAVVEQDTSDERRVLDVDTWTAPVAYDEAASLGWIRERVLLLLEQHKPSAGAVKYPEGNVRPKYVASANSRLRVEGVILEAMNSRGVPVVTGPLSSISSRVGSKPDRVKGYMEAGDFRGLDMTKRTKEQQEAIMAATSAQEGAKERRKEASGN